MFISSDTVFAQTPPTSPKAELPAIKGQLAPEYIDGSFGFSVRYPAGSVIQREKRFVNTADVELVRFVQFDYIWSFVVRLSTTTRPLTNDMIIKGITSKLSTKHKGLKTLRAEPARIASRQGVRFAASFTEDKKGWLRQQAVICTQPKKYYTLILITPLSDLQIATEAFDKIVDNFQILRSELTEEQLEAALLRGVALRKTIANNKSKRSALKEQDTYLRFVQDGKEVGFVQVRQGPMQIKHHKGMAVREWGWLFNADKSVTHLQHDMFLADDLAYATWDNRVRTLTPAVEGKPEQSALSVETGMRQKDKLLISYTTVFGQSELKDKVIKVEPSFSSPAWFLLLPQLVDLNKPELYAFSAYNSDRRGLILRTFRVVGPTQVKIEGQTRQAIKIEDSEGLIPPISEIDVEPTGRIIRVVAGPLEMIATNRQYIDRQYKSRIDDAMATFKKYPPIQLKSEDRNKP